MLQLAGVCITYTRRSLDLTALNGTYRRFRILEIISGNDTLMKTQPRHLVLRISSYVFEIRNYDFNIYKAVSFIMIYSSCAKLSN